MLDTALFILEGVLLNEKARPTWGVYMSKGEEKLGNIGASPVADTSEEKHITGRSKTHNRTFKGTDKSKPTADTTKLHQGQKPYPSTQSHTVHYLHAFHCKWRENTLRIKIIKNKRGR